MSRPLASVVIPTRDRARLLPAALGSALAQRDVDVEVIVVDDGSADATPALLASLGDQRVRVVRTGRPGGVAAARNLGLAAARGDWVAFLDDDDLWAPLKLARQLDALERTGSAWSCCGAVVVDCTWRPLRVQAPPPDLCAQLRGWNAVPGGGSGVVARRHLLASLGGFDTALSILADWDMWLRLAALGPPAVVAVPLVAYRLQGQSLSHGLRGIRRELVRVRAGAGAAPDRARWRPWLAEMHQRAGRRGRAAASWLAGVGPLVPPRQALRRAAGAVLYGPAAVTRRDAVDAAGVDGAVRRAVPAWLAAARDAYRRARGEAPVPPDGPGWAQGPPAREAHRAPSRGS
jgi:hypothetical protein